MKKYKREILYGVPPEDIKTALTIYKSSKAKQKSYRITSELLDSIWVLHNKLNKQPQLIITITNGSDKYTLTCSIKKEGSN